jgi:heme/copper-type cytochrome/quinol oxidase subunit 2
VLQHSHELGTTTAVSTSRKQLAEAHDGAVIQSWRVYNVCVLCVLFVCVCVLFVCVCVVCGARRDRQSERALAGEGYGFIRAGCLSLAVTAWLRGIARVFFFLCEYRRLEWIQLGGSSVIKESP